jgi:hypothetical protein
MNTLHRLSVFSLFLAAVVLSGCGKKVDDARATPVQPSQTERMPATSGSTDPSVPPAASVLPPAVPATPDPAGVRMNGDLTKAQESSAMPMPGQNNDHSVPAPAKRASGTQ